MNVESLNLAPAALRAAQLLAAKHPHVVFTSGRRDLVAQAHAMATNTVQAGRGWIAKTYADSAPVRRLTAWLKDNPHATSRDQIAAGLLSVMQGMSDEELSHVSKHLAGLAFDVQPIPGAAGEIVKQSLRTLPGATKFLDHEGGLTRWHVQF